MNPARVAVPGEPEFESPACPLGCGAGDVTLFEAVDRLHGLPGKFAVVRCRRCGLMRTSPRPTPRSMSFYYPEEYSPHRASSSGSSVRPGWRSLVKRMIDFRTVTLPPLREGRLLEIGCGSGAFLKSMASLGWTVDGIELSPSAAEVARSAGGFVFAGPVDQAPEPAEPYDLVVAWMALEHLHEPIAVLRKLRQWVRPEGWLAVSVPNAGSLEFRVFRDSWYALQAPTHLFHFTPRSLSRVLHEGGWQLERLMHQRILSNLIASSGYWLSDRGASQALAQRLIRIPDATGRHHYWLYPLAVVLAAFGQTGRMTAWARPRATDRA